MTDRTDTHPADARCADEAMALDVRAVRAVTSRLLAEGASPPSEADLPELLRQLRGYIVIAIPDVERAAGRYATSDIPRRCAEAGVGEARRALDAVPMAGFAFAQRLARVINALLDHHRNLITPAAIDPIPMRRD
jgi:hypothetical protein